MTTEDTAHDDHVDEKALREQIKNLEDHVRRVSADFDNYRKRTAREAEQLADIERIRTAAAWLPVLDNLDVALDHADADPASIVEGVKAVRELADAVMARLGFARRAEEAGTPFDPVAHEAVSTVQAGEVSPGTIVEVVRPGYGEGPTQLRPAAVVVARQD
ncbi:nucleotide exchange factor GrpE [Amycolatopsis sp. WAC 04182]|uniref:nucleotide exchange factor GrpE n=1 Tax=Amycolatopsis sp. WAC 04182 TaxID=2203198 RepID=UPI000F79C690|nr:nucleotide exchange factor GrpE [Amycolatopsis sp. WAC 04182]RSN55024.1 nucleotide exchange factor GrpE [Amycolatopsis sp. WAC 04182]